MESGEATAKSRCFCLNRITAVKRSKVICQQRIQRIHRAGILTAGICIDRYLRTEVFQLLTGTGNIRLAPWTHNKLLFQLGKAVRLAKTAAMVVY